MRNVRLTLSVYVEVEDGTTDDEVLDRADYLEVDLGECWVRPSYNFHVNDWILKPEVVECSPS